MGKFIAAGFMVLFAIVYFIAAIKAKNKRPPKLELIKKITLIGEVIAVVFWLML